MTQDNGMDANPSWQELRHALHKLQLAEATYRQKHDRYGGDSLATGQAWDHMRRAGHQARQLLQQAGGE